MALGICSPQPPGSHAALCSCDDAAVYKVANTPAPGTLLLSIWQGQTYDQQLLLQDQNADPLNLTGFTAQMMLRVNITDATPIATWGTATGEIVLGGTAGTLTFAVPGSESQALPTNDELAIYVYDILLTNGATPPYTQRVVQGTLVVYPAVTRPAGT